MTADTTSVLNERRILCVMRWPVGGIRTYILYFYPELADAGFRFTFVGPADETFKKFREDLVTWEGVEFVEAPRAGDRFRFCSTVRRLLKSGRFTLVHSQGVRTAVEVVLGGVGLNVPHLMTSHDVFRPVHRRGLLGDAKLRLLGEILKRIDVIVAVSEDVRRNHLEYLPRLAQGPNRVTTIPNGIDIGRFAATTLTSPIGLRNRFGLGPEVRLAGFLGRFMEQKGFLVLVEALGRLQEDLPRVPFRMIAVGSGEFEPHYRAEVTRRGLDHMVLFHPFVPDACRVLRELDLLVMPSLWEACPLLPMEAMASGVPVLGTDCIGLREVLRDTPSEMVPSGAPLALAKALKRLLERPPTEEAEAFVPEACSRFDVRRRSDQLHWLFEELTRGKADEAKRQTTAV